MRLMTTVFTIGHSTRNFDELLGMLRAHDVNVLADVRSYPSSRKFPQWNQDAIVDALPPDIEYRWFKNLGGRRHTPAGTPTLNTGWRVKAFRDYADYMATEPFQEGLAELITLAETQAPAIMCSEAVPWRCHRRLITDALIARGVEVIDIMSATKVNLATLTEFAVVGDETITYPPKDPQ